MTGKRTRIEIGTAKVISLREFWERRAPYGRTLEGPSTTSGPSDDWGELRQACAALGDALSKLERAAFDFSTRPQSASSVSLISRVVVEYQRRLSLLNASLPSGVALGAKDSADSIEGCPRTIFGASASISKPIVSPSTKPSNGSKG